YVLSGNEQVLYGSFLNAPEIAPATGELGMYKENEKRLILTALSETRWNRRRAAKLLGMSYNTLRRRIERYKLKTAATARV
ncbi:MAG: helix-turn-helix domain-containing protein, partial [Candidatus Hydrogenedentes bacterium]|nr:helix-turn-helix domain-containing protein [Candidatus Hydrogenedentota bacterium]